MGGGASSVVASLFLTATFSANALDFGVFSESKKILEENHPTTDITQFLDEAYPWKKSGQTGGHTLSELDDRPETNNILGFQTKAVRKRRSSGS